MKPCRLAHWAVKQKHLSPGISGNASRGQKKKKTSFFSLCGGTLRTSKISHDIAPPDSLNQFSFLNFDSQNRNVRTKMTLKGGLYSSLINNSALRVKWDVTDVCCSLTANGSIPPFLLGVWLLSEEIDIVNQLHLFSILFGTKGASNCISFQDVWVPILGIFGRTVNILRTRIQRNFTCAGTELQVTPDGPCSEGFHQSGWTRMEIATWLVPWRQTTSRQ